MAGAAANYREGGAAGFERLTAYATPGLAYIVEIEHYEKILKEGVSFRR